MREHADRPEIARARRKPGPPAITRIAAAQWSDLHPRPSLKSNSYHPEKPHLRPHTAPRIAESLDRLRQTLLKSPRFGGARQHGLRERSKATRARPPSCRAVVFSSTARTACDEGTDRAPRIEAPPRAIPDSSGPHFPERSASAGQLSAGRSIRATCWRSAHARSNRQPPRHANVAGAQQPLNSKTVGTATSIAPTPSRAVARARTGSARSSNRLVSENPAKESSRSRPEFVVSPSAAYEKGTRDKH